MTGLGAKHSLSHLPQIENAGQFALIALSALLPLNPSSPELPDLAHSAKLDAETSHLQLGEIQTQQGWCK
jgi:hypothetical protein